ncbi:MAG: hypothetical protein DCC58_05090 [Chloroflexi bacterium]|nr:MAG: hypothetical protein DCC58_05090 [Chloroflexota bacterium]
MATDPRAELISQHEARQADLRAQIARLEAEYAAIAKPVLEFRETEARMRRLSETAGQLKSAMSATQRAFQESLERAVPPELTREILAARRTLSQRVRPTDVIDARRLTRIANLRRWLDAAEAACADPAMTSDQLRQIAEAGAALNEGAEVSHEQKEALYVIS